MAERKEEHPPANRTKGELQQNNKQLLEIMARMALVHLNNASSGSSDSNIGGEDRLPELARAHGSGSDAKASVREKDLITKDTKHKIPKIWVSPPEEDELPVTKRPRKSVMRRRLEPESDANSGLYGVPGYPEEGEYTMTFPKAKKGERERRGV